MSYASQVKYISIQIQMQKQMKQNNETSTTECSFNVTLVALLSQ